MRNLSRGVKKVKLVLATSPSRDLKTALNGYSMREMVEILLASLGAERSTLRRESRSVREEKQLLFGFLDPTIPTDCPQS